MVEIRMQLRKLIDFTEDMCEISWIIDISII